MGEFHTSNSLENYFSQAGDTKFSFTLQTYIKLPLLKLYKNYSMRIRGFFLFV